MSGIDKLIKEMSQSEEFKQHFEQEKANLDVAVAMMFLRDELKLTQRELAEKVGKPQSTIARIENGNLHPSIKLLREIAERTGKTLKLTFN